MTSRIDRIPRSLRALALFTALGLAAPVQAGPGHDGGHDHDDAPSLAAATAEPRFETHSDVFEVVGALTGGELVLWLDHYATNEPVPDARVELESGSYQAVGEFLAERGLYRFEAAALALPGTHPITLTVTTAADADLLAADLVVPEPPAAAIPSALAATNEPLLWGAGALAAFAALALGLRRLRRRPDAASS